MDARHGFFLGVVAMSSFLMVLSYIHEWMSARLKARKRMKKER
jgi:hypothetical protein